MPILLIIVGIIMVVSGVRNTEGQFLSLVKSDFVGGPNNNGFLSWMLAITALVVVGFYKPIRPISNGLLVLVFVIIFLSNKGIAGKFVSQTSNTGTP